MPRSVSVLFVSLVLAGAWPCPAWADPFKFTTIDVPNSRQTRVFGINDAGQIVGDFWDHTLGSHAFLLSEGTFTTIDHPEALGETRVSSINDAGQIVGSFDGADATHGFLLSEGTFTTIDHPEAIFGTGLSDINDAGQIVGGFDSTAFLLSEGTFTTIDAPGYISTSAGGINNAGQIVGTVRDDFYHESGFLLSEGTFTTIDVPGSSLGFTRAHDINDVGQIVGLFHLDDPEAFSFSFLLSEGTFSTIEVPGSDWTYATGINDAGQIVGFFQDAAGERHGFLATPVPEPRTLIMLGVGVVGLLWRGRQRQLLRRPPSSQP